MLRDLSAARISYFHHLPKARSVRTTSLAVLFMALGPLLSACSLIPDRTNDSVAQAVAQIDRAIQDLNNSSEGWQQTLQDLSNNLVGDAQSTIRTEVQNLLNRALGAAGAEFRCNADFIAARVRQELINLKNSILGKGMGGAKPDPLEPALCQVVPETVDMSVAPDRRNHITFYGYDLDSHPLPKAFLVTSSGKSVDVTDKLDRQTHYQMTLNLGSNGVPVTASSSKIVLKWQDTELSSVPVVQHTPPPCDVRTVGYDPGQHDYTPPFLSGGDKDFDAHGPNIDVDITLIPKRTTVDAQIYMNARETDDDWTTADGTSKPFAIFTAPDGYRVKRVLNAGGQLDYPYSFTDTDEHDNIVNTGGDGVVRRLTIVGDTSGDEAGTRTQVTVDFNVVRVEVEQIDECTAVPAKGEKAKLLVKVNPDPLPFDKPTTVTVTAKDKQTGAKVDGTVTVSFNGKSEDHPLGSPFSYTFKSTVQKQCHDELKCTITYDENHKPHKTCETVTVCNNVVVYPSGEVSAKGYETTDVPFHYIDKP